MAVRATSVITSGRAAPSRGWDNRQGHTGTRRQRPQTRGNRFLFHDRRRRPWRAAGGGRPPRVLLRARACLICRTVSSRARRRSSDSFTFFRLLPNARVPTPRRFHPRRRRLVSVTVLFERNSRTCAAMEKKWVFARERARASASDERVGTGRPPFFPVAVSVGLRLGPSYSTRLRDPFAFHDLFGILSGRRFCS